MKKDRVYQIGDFTLNVDKRSLYHPEKTVTLTARECVLLHKFIEAEGKTVKNYDMLMSVWGFNDFFNARSYDVFIAKLRKYLKLDPNVKLGTERSVGKYLRVEKDKSHKEMLRDKVRLALDKSK